MQVANPFVFPGPPCPTRVRKLGPMGARVLQATLGVPRRSRNVPMGSEALPVAAHCRRRDRCNVALARDRGPLSTIDRLIHSLLRLAVMWPADASMQRQAAVGVSEIPSISMTHPALACLNLEDIRSRGRDARKLGLSYFSNPFANDTDLELEECVRKGLVWSDGWMQEDAGRSIEEIHGRLRPLLLYPGMLGGA